MDFIRNQCAVCMILCSKMGAISYVKYSSFNSLMVSISKQQPM